MQIKDGVNIQGIDIRMRPALIVADELWKRFGQELVVTGGLEGVHSAGSLHYYGFALDFRTRYFELGTIIDLTKLLQENLGADFDVIQHRSHIHVEYDPK